MAVNYNRHRQNIDFSKQFGSKRNCSPKNHPENVSVEYLKNRSSPNRIHNSNSKPDQKTITITVKQKNKQKKQKTLKDNVMQRVKKTKETSLFTVCDYLKVLAKKCSTPDAHQPHVHGNLKRRCSDTCLNMSTPFKTKTIVNTVSMDPKKIPPGCKNLLNHPLMQAQFSIYRCQLNKDNGACKTCNSAAIFEVVKCLYDCYKKKKCDPCKCVACGYLPKDIRKLIKEVNRSSASVGVETASTNRNTRSTMTSAEDELLSILQNEAKPAKHKITESEKLRMAKAFGILTPPESPGSVKLDRADQREQNADYMIDSEACPDVNVQFEKMLFLTNLPETGPTLRVPSKKLRKARASGLLTPLDGKTQQQKEKMLRHLAMNDIPLPEGKTESEKQVITKVRRELGLPPGPRTPEEKERYVNAQAAGFITPLKGKSQLQKENILRSLLENGIPLPEGRRPSEKALIEKIELERLFKPVTKSDTEKTIKHRARSYVHTLFNKFTNETGYMVLVETSCVKDKFCNLQAKGFLTPIENVIPTQEANILRLIRPKETKSLEKALFKEVEIGVRLIPESQGKTQIRKVIRRTGKESVKVCDGQTLTKKFVKIQRDPRIPLEERTKSKGKLLLGTVVSGNPLPNSRTSLEDLFDQRIKDKARSSNVIIERKHKTKLRKSESEQAKVIKGFADAKSMLTKDYVPLEKEIINKVRNKTKTLEHTCQRSVTGTPISQKISKGTVTKLISKLVSHIKEDLNNNRAGLAKFERDAGCDKKKLSFRNSYLTIKLSVSDVSDATTARVTRSVFTDMRDIRQTSDIATSIPSIPNSNSTAADETETPEYVPTKEKKKNKKKSPIDKNQTSGNSTNEDSKSAFCFNFVSDTDDTARVSQDKESDLEANADLIYIYKPTFEYNAKGMLTTSSRIILTDSYNISPATSGSLYLIETGSTDSYDSGTTDFSYATRDTSETETGTDVYYTQRSEDEHSKETSSEPRIFWFYRNSIHKTSQPTGRDPKIYLVSEVKMRQQTSEQAQRSKKQAPLQVSPYRHCNLHNPTDSRAVPAPRQTLRRSSSIFLVVSPSYELSTEDLSSLIYVEKLDSVSKMKTIKLMPHENAQKLNPIKMFKRCTRVEEKIQHSETGKCSETRPVPASHNLPVTNAFTKCSCNKGGNNRGSKREYSSLQFQKPRIPPKYSENPKMTTGIGTWNNGLSSKLPACSTTCRLGVNPEQRIGYSEKQRMGPKYIDTCPDTTQTAHGSKDPLYKAITRYLHSTKRAPEHRLVTAENSKVCLISTTHSSKYRVPSKVSFSDDLKYIRRGNSSEPCEEKCLDPNSPKKRPCQGPNECKNSTDESSCCSSDEKAKRLREKIPQFKLKITPKSSKIGPKSARGTRESKVRFDHPMNACCPCDKTALQKSDSYLTKDEIRPCASEKKAPKKSQIDCSKKEPKPCDGKKKTSLQSDTDLSKKTSKPCKNQKKIEEQSDTDVSKDDSKTCNDEKKTSDPSDSDLSKKESKPCEKKRISCDIDQTKSESKQCVKKQTSLPCDTDQSKSESKPCENKKSLSKSESVCERKATTSVTTDQQSDLESTCKTVAKELPDEETKKNPCDPGQTPTDKRSIITKECSSQCRETVKRATSPMNVDVKTVGVDGSSTSKPSCSVEKPKIVCPEKDNLPEKPLNICNRESKESLKTSDDPCNRKKLTTASTDKQADKNVDLNQQTKSECLGSPSARVSVTQPINECVKQKMVTEQFCPPNSTPDSTAQPADVCVKLNQQVASECPQNNTQDSVAPCADANVKSGQQTASECPANSTLDSVTPAKDNVKLSQQITPECPVKSIQDSVAQPTEDNAKLCQQKSSECPANSPRKSIAQPCNENVKLSDQKESECPANSTRESMAPPCSENDKLSQQKALECPAKSTQESMAQPCDENVKLSQQMPPECPANSIRFSKTELADDDVKLSQQETPPCPANSTLESTAQPCSENVKLSQQMESECPAETANEKNASNHYIPCQNPLENNEIEQPSQVCPDPSSKRSRQPSTHKPLTPRTDSNIKSCVKYPKGPDASCNKEKKHGRIWWCRKKNMLLRRRGHPAPHRSIEENTMETQCERDVRDLAQMTDDLLQMTNDMVGIRGDPEQCVCGDTVKPCQCLHDLAQTMRMGGVTIAKPKNECECPPPILIIKGHQQQHYETDAHVLTEQHSHCSCIAFLQNHNMLHRQQMVVNQNVTEIKGLGQMPEQQASKQGLYNYNTNDFSHCPQLKTPDGASKPVGPCDCKPSTTTEQGDQNNKDGTCQGMILAPSGNKNTKYECPGLTTAEQMIVGQYDKAGTCPGMMSDGDGKKNVPCKFPQPKAKVQTIGGQDIKDGPCQGLMSAPSDKKNITCECPQAKATGQTPGGQSDTVGTCQGMVSAPEDKKKITCECPPPKATGQMAGGQNSTGGTCQGMVSGPGDKKKITCECPPLKAADQVAGGHGTCQGMMSGPCSKKNASHECPGQRAIEHTAGGENVKVGTCQGMPSGPGSKKNVICECPPLKATDQCAGGQYGKDGTCLCMTPGPGGKVKVTCECPPPKAKDGACHCMTSGPGGKAKVTCECPPPKATEGAKDGACQCMKPGPGGKMKVTCECPPPKATEGACQCMTSGAKKNVKCECPPPTTIVKEQSTAIQCKKVEQSSCENLAKVESCQSKQSQDPNAKSGRYKKTVICESPSKDKLQLSSPKSGKTPCQKTAGPKKILNLSLKKKGRGQAEECLSSDDGTGCQNSKSRVKWCQKKYVISECPPLGLDKHCDPVCLTPERKKQLKKNAKKGEKKLDTSCTHGATRCMCKDEPFCRLNKNHKCECPCPLFVEEVDLNSGKECPPVLPCPKECPPEPPSPTDCQPRLPCDPIKDVNEKKNQKKSSIECNQGQMTEEKIDKCSYTDRPIKNICKTKNKSSGQGKWAKKKVPPCCCPPEPPTTERGCDPPCVKEQWKMRSRETCSKSGFSVKKKPAPRIDHTMCFEEALAYFEQHPEDDPMQQRNKKKKKKKVLCECPPSDFCSSFGSTPRTLPYCTSQQY